MSEEKSGIDMLKEILFKLTHLEKKMDVLEQNIKAIANSSKMAELINKAKNTPMDDWAKASAPVFDAEQHKAKITKEIQQARQKAMQTVNANTTTPSFKNFNFDSSNMKKTPNPVAPKKPVVVKGTLEADVNGAQVKLPGINVKIFDEQDKLVKTTRTNKAGQWLSHLRAGKYIALFEGEFNGEKLLSQNRNFEVPEALPDGIKEIEVR